MRRIALLLLLLSLVITTESASSKCDCSKVTCPSTHHCKVGLLPDVCGCCMLCAYEEGKSCYSDDECGSNLTCVFRRASDDLFQGKCERGPCVKTKCSPGRICTLKNSTAVCECPVCSPSENQALCDVQNNKEYHNECEFNKAECKEGKFLEAKRGPCDDSVNVICEEQSMSIIVRKDIISPNDISTSFTLHDPTCEFETNDTHLFIKSKFDECGTTRQYTYSSVIYSNKARGFHNSAPNIIRSSQLHVPFKCQYSFMYNKAIFPEIELHNATITSVGRRISVKKENEDSGQISIIIDPSKRYIIEFRTKRLFLTNDTVFPRFCYATPEAPSQRWMRYTLIENSCILEEGVSTYVQTNNTYRMYIPGIRFKRAEYPTITVKCKLVKCTANDAEVCEKLYGCQKEKNARRRRRNVNRIRISRQTEYLSSTLFI